VFARYAARLGWRPATVVLSCAALAVLPIVPKPLPAAAVTPLPSGWTQVFGALRLPASASVLVVPVPMSTFTEPLRWQADTGVPGSLVGGYFLGPASNGQAYVDGDGTPAASLFLNELWLESQGSKLPGTVKQVTPAAMIKQLTAWRVSAVVAVTPSGSQLAGYLTSLLGQPSAGAGDVLAWRFHSFRARS
jgi:hypothetical protein